MTAARGVVVGYDGSPSSEVALTWAIEEARRSGLPLTLVHTAEVDLAVYGTGVGGGDWAYARSDVVGDSDSVTRAKEALGEDLVTVHRTLGNAARHLVEASHDADLVVTGTRGHGHLTSVLLGSTAYAVAAHAHCPVVVVRVPPRGPTQPVRPDADHPVVVGVDDLAPSGAALEAAAEVAERSGAPLRVVRAVEYHAFIPTIASDGATVAEYDEALRHEAHRMVADAAAKVREKHPDLVIEEAALDGAPAFVLGRESHKAGLVVVGSRGRGGFAGLLLGSTSHALLHEAACPVMVVRS
ncbi:MAG: universal stress protein [Austwickia sp.]|nr:universal stress protein [Austwickia sp.]HRW02209.1 universal stress protein [Tetrasphaera sp.]